VPTEEVVEIRRGRKVNAERKFLPGYVLVKMDLSDEAYHLIKNTPKVTGFLGSASKPAADLREAEAARMILRGRRKASSVPSRPSASRSASRFASPMVRSPAFNGSVEEVDEAREPACKVAVSIFGRATPVELEYSQVEKVV
jgi:transcriptional antiterminator NusG